MTTIPVDVHWWPHEIRIGHPDPAVIRRIAGVLADSINPVDGEPWGDADVSVSPGCDAIRLPVGQRPVASLILDAGYPVHIRDERFGGVMWPKRAAS